MFWVSSCKQDLQTSRNQWMWLCWKKQKGKLVKSERIFVSCSGFPCEKTGMRKDAFIAWILWSAWLSIPTSSLLTLWKSCWMEEKALYIWTSLSAQARRAGGAVGSGWDVLPWCFCHTWICLTPQGLQPCTTLEHFHFNRHSSKYSLQKWLFFTSCLIMDLKRKKKEHFNTMS